MSTADAGRENEGEGTVAAAVSGSMRLDPTGPCPDDACPDDACPAEPLPMGDFLVTVGRRVRRQRGLLHMSRRRLAERSGVSERYLAQLETGRGNMSIVLLRRVALALEMPLPALVAEDDADSVSERIGIPL